MSDPPRFQPGDVLADRYRLEAPIGAGGMGEVWRAEHLLLRSCVAIKLLHGGGESPAAAKRFLREARATAQLRGPNVVQVLDVGEHEGVLFIAMELLAGRSLKEKLDREGKLSLAATSRILAHVGRALVKAHGLGIVHRDLKPANIQIVDEPDGEVAKVLDFGIAKLQEGASLESTAQTERGAMLGTPSYMSPEQLRGAPDIDHRTDLWALAIVAYECLLGERPYRGSSIGALVMAVCSDPPPVPSRHGEVPAGFDEWFARATSRAIADRFQSVEELWEAFERIEGAPRTSVNTGRSGSVGAAGIATTGESSPLQGSSERTPPQAPTPPPPLTAPSAEARPRRPVVLGAIALGLLAAGAAWWVTRSPGGEPEGPPPGASAVAAAAPSSSIAAQVGWKHRQLTFSGTARMPVASPDGQTLYFVSDDGADAVISRQHLSGGEPRELGRWRDVDGLDVSRDGKKLVACGLAVGGALEAKVFDPDGAVLRELPPAVYCAWGPGDVLATVERPFAREIRLLSPDGSVRTLPVEADFTFVRGFAWNRADDRLLFATVTGAGKEDLLAIPWQGGAFEHVRKDGGPAGALRPGPIDLSNGATLAAIDAILSGLRVEAVAPAAEGARLFYQRVDAHSNLWSIELAGSGPSARTQLTRGTRTHTSPRISPDGRRLAFIRSSNGSSSLFVMPTEGGPETRLTPPDLHVTAAAWGPDGRNVAFVATVDGIQTAFTMPSTGGAPRRVATDFALSGPGPSLEWAPSEHLLVQVAGNKNFARVNPETGTSTPFLAASEGWVFWPKTSSRGDVAFTHNVDGSERDGVWVLRKGARAPKLVAATRPGWPIVVGWSEDGLSTRVLFSSPGAPTRIDTFSREGKPSPFFTFDFSPEAVSEVDFTPDGQRVVANVAQRQSDIWLVDRSPADAPP
jgi:serine/threonine protein kinase/dipeptidyl aminopeptidase/acylaminoacyl peptidase